MMLIDADPVEPDRRERDDAALVARPARPRRRRGVQPGRKGDAARRRPAALRDDAGDVRLDILNDKEGVWRCRTTFNCTEACPRGIEVTKAIAEVKQAVLRGRA